MRKNKGRIEILNLGPSPLCDPFGPSGLICKWRPILPTRDQSAWTMATPAEGGIDGVYFERQRHRLCAVHAANNLLGSCRFKPADFEKM